MAESVVMAAAFAPVSTFRRFQPVAAGDLSAQALAVMASIDMLLMMAIRRIGMSPMMLPRESRSPTKKLTGLPMLKRKDVPML